MTMSRCAVLGNFGVIIYHDNNIIVVWSSAEPYHGLFVSGNNNALLGIVARIPASG